MKAVVLFGSFNPLTNAHIEVMKYAKGAVGADLGLFVATNDKYLSYKTSKRNEYFRLSEEERKFAIEKTCEGEEGLSFWGYELGGAVPKRYATLCKIKKDYPDAEIYEIEGADKVKSLPIIKTTDDHNECSSTIPVRMRSTNLKKRYFL